MNVPGTFSRECGLDRAHLPVTQRLRRDAAPTRYHRDAVLIGRIDSVASRS
jgi:hypothetical protein